MVALQSEEPARGRGARIDLRLEHVRKLSRLVPVLLLSACAANVATRVLPREDGTISAISVAREKSIAASASVKEANRYCDKRNGMAVFLDEETLYQGMWGKQAAGVDRVVNNIPVIGDKLKSDEDYQVTTRFKCLPAE